MTAPTSADEKALKDAIALARVSGLYVVPKEELLHGKRVLMYYLFKRLRFGSQGAFIGKRRTAEGLLKLAKKTMGVS